MSSVLATIGRFGARHRWVTIGAWLLVFVALTGIVVGNSAGKPAAPAQTIPDTQASLALERLQQEFGAQTTAGGDSLQLVVAPTGGDVRAVAGRIDELLTQARQLPGAESVSDPFDPSAPYVSADGEVAVATITYGELDADAQETSYAAALALQQAAPAELGVELGGNLVPLGAPEQGVGEVVGVLAALLVLALTFGSLLAAGANLVLAAVGVGVGLLGILAYGTFQPLGDNAIILAAMLGLAVGIDYSLFILSRFRTELRAGNAVVDAVGRAVGTAGTAVLFAGTTVVVALVALLVADINFITEMGIAAAVAVAVAVAIALTLLPAVMGLLGTRALSRRQRSALARGELWTEQVREGRGVLRGFGALVVRRPVIALALGITALAVVAAPVVSLQTAFTVPGGADPESTERAAYTRVLDEFGGVQSPLIVLAEGTDVGAATGTVQADLAARAGVLSVTPGGVSADGRMAQFVVVPDGGPLDARTEDLVHGLRADADTIAGIHLEVTGEAAIGLDTDASLRSALIRYVLVIVAISLLLMVLLFRSILIPVVATLGYLLSVGAAFGASVAVFQWGWFDAVVAAPQGDPMMSLLPLLLVGVLFGLAMDYQVFLVTRIQEMHRRGMPPKAAVREGFARSAPVLVAAASIMVVVFAGFATSSFAMAASISFGLMVGVAADAFVVRLVLVPAVMSLLGHRAWWIPRWLDRILPHVDVEGSGVEGSGLERGEVPAPRHLGAAPHPDPLKR